MKSNQQVEVIAFTRPEHGEPLCLMLKRSEAKGGFWQPVTGAVHVDETLEAAAKRELLEETGIVDGVSLVDTGYSYSFVDNGREHREWVFGAEVPVASRVHLSAEHTEFRWVSMHDALDQFLKWPGNKAGLLALCDLIGNRA